MPLILEYADNKDADYLIANTQTNIPYSVKFYDMLVRSKEPITKINLYQNDELLESVVVNENQSFEIIECDNRIGLNNLDSQGKFSAVLKNVNKKVKIGEYKLVVYSQKDSVEYEEQVKWINSPVSLYDPEFAIEVLKIVFSKIRS